VNSPDLVIFDCDGVLIDSEVIACRVRADYLTEIGFTTSIAEINERYIGISMAAMLADLEARHGRKLPAGLPEALRRHVMAAFEKELRPMPGVVDMLDQLACRMCVASSGMPERVARSLSLVGLLARFTPNIFSAEEVAHGKPAPDLFLHAAERMGVGPTRCLVIEDSIAGVTAARAAGMTVFGFVGGGHCGPHHAGHLRTAGADAVLGDMAQLANAITLGVTVAGN
jgi:HAD superfamily hydrolase (TIGR01509 family)